MRPRFAAVAFAALVHQASPTSAAGAPAPSPAVAAVTSTTMTLTWPREAAPRGATIAFGAEPPPTAGAPLPGGLEAARLAAGTTSFTLRELAPAARVFVRVTPAGDAPPFVLTAVTRGGPRAPLDGPVRAVHLAAPDVMVVVLANGDGARWARGPWRVRRADGVDLTVTPLGRRSIPVGQPGYRVGFRAPDDLQRVDVDHQVALRLSAPVGARALLRVDGPDGLAFWLPFSDRFLETPVVQLNQVGYAARATRRWAYVSAWLGTAGPLSLDGFPPEVEVLREPRDPRAPAEPVARLPLEPRSAHDADAGTEVRQIDLSSVPAREGARLRIRVPGVGVSWTTEVSERGPSHAFFVMARGLFHNRWACDLTPASTEWPRRPDHQIVFTAEQADAMRPLPEDTPRVGARPLRGGYHDAGDFDQRPMHVAVAQLLLRAYEAAPARFPDRQLRLPESGNGVPDLLDEALWGVAGWADLQEADGGVRAGVESWRHPWGVTFADDDPLPYWTFARDANVTARAAGLFAQAARLLAPYDAARARALAERARRAWAWATAHGAGAAFRLYGAGELHALTGEPAFARAFDEAEAALGPYGAFSAYALEGLSAPDYARGSRCTAADLLAALRGGAGGPAFRARAPGWMARASDDVIARVLDSPHAHRNPRGDGPFGWGSAAVMGRHLEPVLARLALGGLDLEAHQRAYDALSVAADYVLGANPMGLVYVTGLGARHPEEPLHLDSLAWLARGRSAVPGIPVFGPTSSLPESAWYGPGKRALTPAFDELPPMLRYVDLRTFVNTNEFSVWEAQAPHVAHFAALTAAPPRTAPPPGTTPRSPPGARSSTTSSSGARSTRRSPAGRSR